MTRSTDTQRNRFACCTEASPRRHRHLLRPSPPRGRPGVYLQGTDELTPEVRYRRIPRWSCRTIDGVDRATFACHPGAQAALAYITDNGGSVESVLQLPDVSTLIDGAGIEPFSTEIEMPDLAGGSLILCQQLNSR